MRLALVVLAGCSSARPVVVQNTRPVELAPEPALELDPERCDLANVERVAIDDRESVAIVNCRDPLPPGAKLEELDHWSMRAYLVRGRSATTGTASELGDWMQTRESGRYFEIAGVLRDASGRPRRIIVREAGGGIDGPEGTTYHVYDPVPGVFTAQRIEGLETQLVLAPDGATGHVVICKRLTPTFELGRACTDVPSRTTTVRIE